MSLAVRRRLPALTAGLVLVLAGCGSDSEGSSESTAPQAAPSTSAAAASSKAKDRRVVDPEPQPVPGDLANFTCERRRGVWSATGDIVSSAREPMVYTLTVVTVAGADVAGEDSERVLLRPGNTTGFEMSAISRGPADACMPRLVAEPR